MLQPLMNEKQLVDWILRRLGAPLVKIELTEPHIEDAIESAKRWFAAKKGVRVIRSIAIEPGRPDYVIPDEIDTVLEVAFPETNADLTLIFSPYLLIDQKVPYDVFASASSGGLYSSFTQSLQYVEMAKRVLSAEQDWRQEDRTLYLSPVPRMTGNLALFGNSSVFTIEQLKERDHDLLKRYALAQAKKDLGRVRTKYTEGFAGAHGNVTLDGERLLDEAKEEVEALDKEIALSAYPMGILIG
jgi:hypothetical protein